MRFERGKDIVTFRGKSPQEKLALLRKAEVRDPWIMRLKLLMCFFVFGPLAIISNSLDHRLLVQTAIIIIAGLPIATIFCGFLIVPRIRKALDADAQSKS